MASTVELESLLIRITGDSSHYQNTLQQAQAQTQRAAAAIQQNAALMARGAQVTQSVRTATEIYGSRMAELKTLLRSGAINQETFTRATRQARDALDKAGASGQTFGFGMRRWALQAIGALGPLTGMVGLLGSAFQGVRLAADMEQLEIAFEVLVGDADRAQAAIKSLVQFAAETPFEIPEVVGAAKQMLGFGETAENIVPTMRMLGDVASGLGLNLGELTYVFGTLKAQGRAMTQDINQFALRGIPIWQELGQVMFQDANAVNQVRKAVEEGQVSFEIVQQAFRNMTREGGRFGGMMERQSQSVLGLFSTMRDSINGALRELGKIIIETFRFKEIMQLVITAGARVEAFFKSLSPEMKALVGGLAALTAGAATLALAFPFLRMIAVGTFIAMKIALDTLLGPINLIGVLIAAAAAIWVAEVGGMENAIAILMKAGQDFVAWFRPIWNQLANIATSAWEEIKEVALAAWGSIREALVSFVVWASGVWESFSAVTGITWGSIRDAIIEALIEVEFNIRNIGSNLEVAWVRAQYEFVRLAAEIEHFFTATIPAALQWFRRNWVAIFTAAFNWQRDAMATLGRNIVTVFQNIPWRDLWAGFRDSLEQTVTNTVSAFQQIPGLISGTISFADIWPEDYTKRMQQDLEQIPQIAQNAADQIEPFVVPVRVEGDLERELRKQWEQGAAALNEAFAAFRERRLREIFGAGAVAQETAAGAAAVTESLQRQEEQARETARAMRDLTFVASGSAEAFSRIAEHNRRLRGSGAGVAAPAVPRASALPPVVAGALPGGPPGLAALGGTLTQGLQDIAGMIERQPRETPPAVAQAFGDMLNQGLQDIAAQMVPARPVGVQPQVLAQTLEQGLGQLANQLAPRTGSWALLRMRSPKRSWVASSVYLLKLPDTMGGSNRGSSMDTSWQRLPERPGRLA